MRANSVTWGALLLSVAEGAALLAGIVVVPLGACRRYDGPLGKSDRAFAYGLLALLLGVGVAPGLWSRGLLVLMAALALLTIWNRSRHGLREAAGGGMSRSPSSA